MLVHGMICFCIFKSSLLFFVEILPYGFCLANSGYGAYLAVDQNLVYCYPEMFQTNLESSNS